MRRVTGSALCLLAALALAAGTAASASAEAPEFGRCKKQAGGKFKNAGCTVGSVPGEERFEWFPGVVKNNFTTANKAETLVTFESTSGTKITCSGESGHGEYSGLKTESGVVLTFTGCEDSHLTCTTSGQPPGTITTASLGGELRVIKTGTTPAKNKVGIEWAPSPGSAFAEFECGPLKFELTGSLIIPLPANAMKLSYTIKFTANKALRLNGEQAALTWTLILTNEEKVEVSTVN
jgi:hypothetical protein